MGALEGREVRMGLVEIARLKGQIDGTAGRRSSLWYGGRLDVNSDQAKVSGG